MFIWTSSGKILLLKDNNSPAKLISCDKDLKMLLEAEASNATKAGESLKHETNIKYLGIMIDLHLNWKSQVTYRKENYCIAKYWHIIKNSIFCQLKYCY